MTITNSQEAMDLIFIMDRSGSMSGSEADTIGGFNSFIQQEIKKELNTRVTTILFDHDYEVLYERKPIHEVPELTDREYWVRGSTALLDAIGRTINTLDKKIDNKTLVVIMTDGYENSSREYTKEQIKNLGYDFNCIGRSTNIYQSEIVGYNTDISTDLIKSLQKEIEEIHNLHYVHNPVRNYCSDSDFVITLADEE